MKKFLIPALIFLVIVGVLAFGLWSRGKKETTQNNVKQPVVREVPLEQRPFISLTPDTRAESMVLYLSNLSGISSFDYALKYSSNGVQRGVIGSGVTLESGKKEYDKKLSLGSESKGVYTYDKNVESGEFDLTLRSGEDDSLEFSANFHLQKGDVVSPLTAKDGKFRFEISSKGLVGQPYVVTMMTVGLPAPITDKKIESNPYGVFASNNGVRMGKVVFSTMGLSSSSYSIGIFDVLNSKWNFVPGNIDSSNKTVSVEASSSGSFILVSD